MELQGGGEAGHGEVGLPHPAGARGLLPAFFAKDLDELLQLVFLGLDPASLKASRLVCRAWHSFIRRRLWGCGKSRGRLEAKLRSRWRNGHPVVERRVRRSGKVYHISCDQERVYCGTVHPGEVMTEV